MIRMKKDFIVTPWEVKGKIDYDKLIRDFGIQLLSEDLLGRIKKHTGELHIFLRRGVFFAHRDLDWVLDEYEKGNKFYLYTGRGPSGHTHIGHLIPWMFTRWLQEKFDVELYFQMTDDEKFLFKPQLSIEDVQKLTADNILDVIAVGFDPNKTRIFSDIDYAKTLYREAIRVAKHLTFSTVKAVFGLKESSNVGQIFFTSMQSVPAFLGSVKAGKNIPCLIPLACDQDPHFRITRDIAPKLGYYKPAIIHSKFLPGLGAGGKMSTSMPSTCIFTTDTPDVVRKKVWNAFTGGAASKKEQEELGGNPDVCTVYQYLYFLFEENDKDVKKRYEKCRKGEIVCGECKKFLTERVIEFLKEHQKRREKAKDVLDEFLIKD